jgi:hypothetical protein
MIMKGNRKTKYADEIATGAILTKDGSIRVERIRVHSDNRERIRFGRWTHTITRGALVITERDLLAASRVAVSNDVFTPEFSQTLKAELDPAIKTATTVLRSTKYADLLAQGEAQCNHGTARIERLRRRNGEYLRIGWWITKPKNRPLDIEEHELLALMKDAISNRVFTPEFQRALQTTL